MFRALLATLLVALLTLPHGICFCELLQTAIAQKAALDDENTPDDHEKDCPCKLRHAMASLDAADDADPTLTHTLAIVDFESACNIGPATAVSTAQSTPNYKPIALIPCALRI